MSGPRPPSAIFTLSILMTVGVMRGIVDMGLSIPRDVSLAAIDDFDWPEIMNPRPTTVSSRSRK